MAKEKIVKKVRSLFKDYPFLWAIKKDWNLSEEIRIETPTIELFQADHFFDQPTPPCYLKSVIWLYVKKSNNVRVTKVVAKKGTKLGQAVLHNVYTGEQVGCVVIVKDIGGIFIIKPPKDAPYNTFISNALKTKQGGK